jgi:hypothetical protein
MHATIQKCQVWKPSSLISTGVLNTGKRNHAPMGEHWRSEKTGFAETKITELLQKGL